MTEQRYDVLAVSRATGRVRYVATFNKAVADMQAAMLREVENCLTEGATIYAVVPTGTYKDGDHYPREEVEA